MSEITQLKSLLPYFILIGSLTAYVAHQKKGRKPIPWFFLGFFFGLLALFTLFFLPKKGLNTLNKIEKTEDKNTILNAFPITNLLWYFLDNAHSQQGPVSFERLKTNYLMGLLNRDSYVWNEKLEEWKKLEELPEYINITNKELSN